MVKSNEPLIIKSVRSAMHSLSIPLVHTSGVRYSNFSYHDIGAISIMIRYISRYNLWFEITMKHYYEVNKLSRKFGI